MPSTGCLVTRRGQGEAARHQRRYEIENAQPQELHEADDAPLDAAVQRADFFGVERSQIDLHQVIDQSNGHLHFDGRGRPLGFVRFLRLVL